MCDTVYTLIVPRGHIIRLVFHRSVFLLQDHASFSLHNNLKRLTYNWQNMLKVFIIWMDFQGFLTSLMRREKRKQR